MSFRFFGSSESYQELSQLCGRLCLSAKIMKNTALPWSRLGARRCWKMVIRIDAVNIPILFGGSNNGEMTMKYHNRHNPYPTSMFCHRYDQEVHLRTRYSIPSTASSASFPQWKSHSIHNLGALSPSFRRNHIQLFIHISCPSRSRGCCSPAWLTGESTGSLILCQPHG